ncbi:MAG: response regulator [Planctomycetia bacterium]|nr:response regulator [Planctomycetia bacterium]
MSVYTPSILITDDDVAFRETLCGVLEPVGFRTLEAGDGEQAVEIVRREQVHLILLDMHMPKLTGLEVARQVRQIKALLPFILLSANLDDQMVEEARRLHAASVLPKPVSGRQIVRAVSLAMRFTYNWPGLLPGPHARADDDLPPWLR